jgi:hypothetical protein
VTGRASAKSHTRRQTFYYLAGAATAALAGLSIFGVLAWRSVTIERAEQDEALRRFSAVRNAFLGDEPILRVDPAGRILRRAAPEGAARPPSQFHVLAYRSSERRLVRAHVPFWFLRMKGPAVQYSLRGTGLDLQRLGVTPAELAGYGPCLVLDETRTTGDRLLVWTE